MDTVSRTALSLTHRCDPMRMKEPFRISGYLFEGIPAVIATLGDGRHAGRGEAAGVYYLNDDRAHMESEIERVRDAIEQGADRQALQHLLPAGGARNALDCAFWELESLQQQRPAWDLAGVPRPRPLVTTFTLPAEDPAYLLARLPGFAHAKSIKLKLSGDLAADTARVETVRRARPDAWIGVDANQGFVSDDLDALVAMLVAQRVSLLEQPLRRGDEQALRGWRSPVPVAADESILNLEELEQLGDLFQVMNIKLDKCGGLTEALAMAALAARMGMQVMVGNMAGSTLSTAPAFVLAQLCQLVDLDGPSSLADDPLADSIYEDGMVMVPAAYWGHA
ncbi:enolase C-terminal domain-like protein [Sphingomonas sp. ASY06-1R]|uniref:enolase C-terminal domain-like protein n=1 Tax=Sphingomonas sp. ASY06-1R TaxID=3445771 RepID=UPI003FA2CBE6